VTSRISFVFAVRRVHRRGALNISTVVTTTTRVVFQRSGLDAAAWQDDNAATADSRVPQTSVALNAALSRYAWDGPGKVRSMNPPSLRELFDALVELDADARGAFFERNRIDQTQRDFLERMLASRASADSALPRSGPEELARVFDDTDASFLPRPGSRIGAFELIAVVGEGGSSTVFRAERTVDGVRQVVALKLLRRALYSPDAKRQFRRERRALAQLQHAGIARLIEGGVTESGFAYIALDFVDGLPITAYAQAHRLDLRARLELFVEVCRAVEAAHRALIVHRDLKPSNVLVTRDGKVKLVDFGIAKLLDADDETETRLPAFTPAYAAPEQRTGAPVTTATDVYALGVLLCELVTGQRVNDGLNRTPSGRIGTQAADGDAAAATPVTRRELRGDFDNIVMKAVAAEPERRYVSAGALVDDIERFLDDRPVAAHPPSSWYRMQKFVVRHRGGVAVAALFVLTLLSAFAVTIWQAGVARQEAARANAVRDFLVSVFKSADATMPRDTRPGIDDILKSAGDRLAKPDSLPDSLRADLLLTLAEVATSVGSYDKATALLDQGEAIVDREGRAGDPRKLDAVFLRSSILLARVASPETVIGLLAPLRATLEQRHDAKAVEGLIMLGEGLSTAGREAEALAQLREAREKAERDNVPLETLLLASVAEAHHLINTLRFQEGGARAEAAIQVWHRMGDPVHRDLSDLFGALALAAEASGDTVRAESAYKEAIALDERFFDKPNPDTAWDLGIYGTFLIAQNRFDEAEPYAVRALDMRRAVFGEIDERTLYAIAGMGKMRYGQRRFEEAQRWYSQGIDTCTSGALKQVVCARLLALRASSEIKQGKIDEAERDVAAAEDKQRAITGENSTGYAYVLAYRIVVEMKRARYADALATADRVLAINRGAKGGMLQSELGIRFQRAQALFELGRNDEALDEVLAIEPSYTKLFPRNGLRIEVIALQARALARANRIEEAEAAAKSALSMDPEGSLLTRAIRDDLMSIATGSPARKASSNNAAAKAAASHRARAGIGARDGRS
jgi:serine/threonine-protein kinase